MSVSGVIARPTPPSGFIGRYHHTLGNPRFLGQALFALRNGFFQGDTAAMVRVLVDEHPAGWSDIIGKDFALDPGFAMPPSYLSREQYLRLPASRQPQCYCHGERQDPHVTFSEANTPMHVSFLYLIDPASHLMEISSYRWPRGAGEPTLHPLYSIALDGPEPSWKRGD